MRLDLELVMIVHGQLDVKHQPTYNNNLMIFSIHQKQCKDGVIEYNYEPARARLRVRARAPRARARARAGARACGRARACMGRLVITLYYAILSLF